MKEKISAIREHIGQMQTDGEKSVLEILYEYHLEHQTYDNEQIRADFNALYQQMHGMPLKEVDKVIYAVCDLCRDHELAGFIEGIKIGFHLFHELFP
jgi:hypothetical protein